MLRQNFIFVYIVVPIFVYITVFCFIALGFIFIFIRVDLIPISIITMMWQIAITSLCLPVFRRLTPGLINCSNNTVALH